MMSSEVYVVASGNTLAPTYSTGSLKLKQYDHDCDIKVIECTRGLMSTATDIFTIWMGFKTSNNYNLI